MTIQDLKQAINEIDALFHRLTRTAWPDTDMRLNAAVNDAEDHCISLAMDLEAIIRRLPPSES